MVGKDWGYNVIWVVAVGFSYKVFSDAYMLLF